MPKIVATIEARMTSKRLPGKVLLPAKNKPMLYYLVQRLKRISVLDDIILAITTNKEDDALEDFAILNNIKFFRGSENDVMKRVLDAGNEFKADIIVEITGDCPLIDPQIVEQFILIFLANNHAYVNNVNIRSYPDGMDTQVFTLRSLEKSYELVSDPIEKEHVSLNIRRNPNLFPHINLVAPPELTWPELGLTLDEEKDYLFLRKIIENDLFKETSSCAEILNILRNNLDWIKINEDVKRKGDS